MADEGRRQMPARVTANSRVAWRSFARDHGVSRNNLIECLGPALNELDKIPKWLADVIEQARLIDAEGRPRSGDS